MTLLTPRTALLMLSAATLAACASTPRYPTEAGQRPGTGPQAPEMARPEYPIRPGPSTPPPERDNGGYTPSPRPSEPVDSGVLPPPRANGGSVDTQQLPPLTQADPEPAFRDPPPPPTYVPPPTPRPAKPRTKVVTTVGGSVVAVTGKPRIYVVKKGQGLDAIARELGVTTKQLAADNDLKTPYRLQPGQELEGPATKGKAYVVQSGDTLFAVAKRFNITAAALAEENDISTKASIRKGQKLLLPEKYRDSGPTKKTITLPPEEEAAPPVYRPAPSRPASPPPPPATYRPEPTSQTPAPSRPSSLPPSRSEPPSHPAREPLTPRPSYTPPVSPPSTNPIIRDDKPPELGDGQISKLAAGRFTWPLRGDILSNYGPKAGGQRNDGVNIGAPAGTGVRAAAAGRVVYAGGDVPGFGVTVLVEHPDGWVTVYGHLSRVDVKMQQQISQGQQIGQVGSSGGVSQPQLHFEVRYSPSPKFKAKAVDPNLVLPR